MEKKKTPKNRWGHFGCHNNLYNSKASQTKERACAAI